MAILTVKQPPSGTLRRSRCPCPTLGFWWICVARGLIAPFGTCSGTVAYPRERNLVVAVAERALHRLHYVSGSLEVPGTRLDCFSLTADVLVSLSSGSPVCHGVAGSASPNVSYLLCDIFNVTPCIAGASTATTVDTWEGLSECTLPVPPGSSAPMSPHEPTLMLVLGLSSLSVRDLATVFTGIAEVFAVHAGNPRAQAEALLGLLAAWGLSLSDPELVAAIQRALHQDFLSGVQLEHAAKF